MTNTSFLLTLRDTARQCPNVLTSKLLRDAADDLEHAINTLALSRTAESMRNLNASWVKAQRVLSTAAFPGGDNSRGGAMRDEPILREAA